MLQKKKEKKEKNPYFFSIFGEVPANANTKKLCRLDVSPRGEGSFYK